MDNLTKENKKEPMRIEVSNILYLSIKTSTDNLFNLKTGVVKVLKVESKL